MNILGPLFDLAAAQTARDQAIEQVAGGVSDWWKRQAADAIARCAAKYPEGFTTDEVWAELRGVPGPTEPRAIGAPMLAAAKAGVIVDTGRVRKSGSVICHARKKVVWRGAR